MATSVKPPFPHRPDNRAALPRIDYRIGGYPEIRDAIWRLINAAPELSEWTHRGADDPGAALVEVAAMVGDTLTFYQEHYANEAFLRTASWEESIRELVRLTGYRLGNATGGEVFFAFTVKGEKSVEIPASFPVKAELASEDNPVDFLTTSVATALPALSEFNLYRARNESAGLALKKNEFEIDSEDPAKGSDLRLMSFDTTGDLVHEGRSLVIVAVVGADLHIRIFNASGQIIVDKAAKELVNEETKADLADLRKRLSPLPDESLLSQKEKKEIINSATSIAGLTPAKKDLLDLKKGDKLMIIPEEPSWLLTNGSIGSQPVSHQNVEVKKVTRILDRLIIETEAPIKVARSGTVRAYRIGRTFSHFGHSAPEKRHESKKSGNEVTGTYEYDTTFTRDWDHNCTRPSASETLPERVIPLDQEVNDLLVGSTAIIEAPILFGSSSRNIVVAREIESLRAGPFGVGDLNGSCTFVTLDENIADNTSSGYPNSDLRTVRFHETTSPELKLRRKTTFYGGNFTNTDQLFFYGTSTEAQKLLNRNVIFSAEGGLYAKRQVVAVETSGYSYSRMRKVTLDTKVTEFSRSDFDEEKPTVTVYGNIVSATQGKLESIVVLGNGDMRETFQSFKLPKSPLTYLQDPTATPSEQPELLVRVEGREWLLVDSFFGKGAKDEVYIVRHDDDGNAWVQFGDGIMGSRLPSGIKNVTAEYRTGIGALGKVKEKTKPIASAKLDGLDKIFLPGEVTGGSLGEVSENARRNAPAALQTLGRLVSLADYESEALSQPGVVTARAAWDISDGSPGILIYLLLAQKQQSDLQFESAATAIRTADKARGINSYPIEVVQCELRYAYLTLQYGYDSSLTTATVEAAIKAKLGLADDTTTQRSGLFGLFNRKLGQAEYRLGIEGAAQNAPGVLWCRITQLGLLNPGDDPKSLYRPYSQENVHRLSCAETELLQLHSSHLLLTPADS